MSPLASSDLLAIWYALDLPTKALASFGFNRSKSEGRSFPDSDVSSRLPARSDPVRSLMASGFRNAQAVALEGVARCAKCLLFCNSGVEMGRF
jgi:hypothetical protein